MDIEDISLLTNASNLCESESQTEVVNNIQTGITRGRAILVWFELEANASKRSFEQLSRLVSQDEISCYWYCSIEQCASYCNSLKDAELILVLATRHDVSLLPCLDERLAHLRSIYVLGLQTCSLNNGLTTIDGFRGYFSTLTDIVNAIRHT
jgi:hypothetical protein